MSAAVKLYELLEARDILDQFLVETEGEETPELGDLFAQLEGSLEEKGQNVARWMREKEAEITALKTEEQFLAKKRKARENALERSKAYFLTLLQQLDRKELGTATAKLCRQNGAPQLVGDVEPELLAKLHEAKFRCVRLVPQTLTLDRREALAMLKSGEAVIAGLSVETREQLRIR